MLEYIQAHPEYFDKSFTTKDGVAFDKADILVGGDGHDIIYGQGGNDLLFGDGSADTVDQLGKTLEVNTTGTSVEAKVVALVNAVHDGTHINKLLLWAEGDSKHPGATPGNDHLYGGEGDDVLFGMEGNDYLYGGDGNDYLFGGSGNDHLYGGSGNDHLYGGSGDDFLDGGAGTNHLDGGAGNDIMVYKEGDTIDGGAGLDFLLSGNAGDDLGTLLKFSQSTNVEVAIKGTGGHADAPFSLTSIKALADVGIIVQDGTDEQGKAITTMTLTEKWESDDSGNYTNANAHLELHTTLTPTTMEDGTTAAKFIMQHM